MALALGVVLATPASAPVQTETPAVVPGAHPVTVEHLTVHGPSDALLCKSLKNQVAMISTPVARSITHDVSIVLTQLT
jgi:hypothetical protein